MCGAFVCLWCACVCVSVVCVEVGVYICGVCVCGVCGVCVCVCGVCVYGVCGVCAFGVCVCMCVCGRSYRARNSHVQHYVVTYSLAGSTVIFHIISVLWKESGTFQSRSIRTN